ncbi:MAG: 2,3-bisphosphoglycerate-independent phosphoglycerate mutase [Candidatus Euphemobacter frigidus]|nr:2,3-bisphosphoglycerate-independent phosphoglycerate mutase [Candidatus Euphemobacter frigidus]MDP8276096.1 2,3-bisphosphoglycerate-independent phosphoglycerate mutase [Candidatus Euphemobacter frigidus]
MKSLSVSTPSKIVLLVLDGVGGLSMGDGTALEVARTPYLDNLAAEGTLRLTDPISPGITPGSGPAHVSLFGYDPIRYQIGRGILEATGINMKLGPDDVAGRGNFASMDENDLITDRRAGRISTDENRRLVKILKKEIREIDGVEVIIQSVKEHRFVVVFRGKLLDGRMADTDPQATGVKSLDPVSLDPAAEDTAAIVKKFIERANQALKDERPANTMLLRGFSQLPHLPPMEELFHLNPAAIATYPMYRGLAGLVGMEILETGETILSEFQTLKENWSRFDFFFVHIKKTDSYGEDGNFKKKVEIIEEVDRMIPGLIELEPDVIAVTGDHSTPCLLKGHSWHPNPLLLWSKYVRRDGLKHFTETDCARGGLGRHPAMDVMPLLLANALKLEKFGA